MKGEILATGRGLCSDVSSSFHSVTWASKEDYLISVCPGFLVYKTETVIVRVPAARARRKQSGVNTHVSAYHLVSLPQKRAE